MKSEHQPIYSKDREQHRESHLHLSDEQKSRIREITLGIDTVDPEILEMAGEDVLHTLENGHRLNRLLENEEKELIGYIACEDFVPGEAYVKYLATSGGTGRNLMREIPAFLKYAKSAGYSKINFHGWNERLNHVLEHFGFTRLRTDRMGEFAADFYEIELAKVKTSEQVEQERRGAFEKKYLGKIRKDYEQTIAKIPEKGRAIEDTYRDLSTRLSQTSGFVFGELQQTVLKLKLARHFQQSDMVDLNVLYDALIESPKFLSTDKGSLHRLFEVHEQKTIQKIAEIRRRRAEMTGEEGLNPFEWVYETQDGEYALARLLNMPHLEEESTYMNHCVGTSDSYISKMKRGEVEIFSVRTAPKVDDATGKLTEDTSVLTIEYNVKTGVIEQMKKYDDEYLSAEDPFYHDVIEILKELRKTKLDTGKPRTIRRIEKSETQHFPDLKPGHLLTDTGEVSWEDFDPKGDALVLKTSRVEITDATPKEILAKMFFVFGGLELKSTQIARTLQEVSEQTMVFVGALDGETLQRLPETIQYYTSPDREPIRQFDQESGGRTLEDMKSRMKLGGHKFEGQGEFMADSDDFKRSIYTDETFTTLKPREKHKLIRLTVADLGFQNGATTQQIFDRAIHLGLDLCPPEVGLEYRISYADQPIDEWVRIGMNQIKGSDGISYIFRVERDGGGSWLHGNWANPGLPWDAGSQFVFSVRPAKPGKQV